MKKVLLALALCFGHSDGMLHEAYSYDSLIRESLVPISYPGEALAEVDRSGVPIWLATVKKMEDGELLGFIPSLYEARVDINAPDIDGNAIIHLLALRNFPAALEVILSYFGKYPERLEGIKIDKLNYMRETALDLAVTYKGPNIRTHKQQMKMVKLLLAHGAQVNFNNWIQGTPLHYAVWFLGAGRNDILQLCIMNVLTKVPEVDVNITNRDGETPLSIAVDWGNTAAAESLLETQKVDFNLVDKNRKTIIQQAAKKKDHRMMQLINRHMR